LAATKSDLAKALSVASVEAQAAAAVAKSQGVAPVVDAAPRRSRAQAAPVDPVQAGFNAAKTILAEELAERDARRRGGPVERDRHGRRRLNEGPKKPLQARRRRFRTDFDETLIADSKGEKAGTPGYVTRWVRTRDHANREVAQRIAEFKRYGFEPIIDPHTGQPITSHLGIAMEAPVEAYGERILDKSKEGAFDREALLEGTRAALDDLNDAADGDVVSLVVNRDHGKKRVRERFGEDRRGREVGELDDADEDED